MYEKGKPGTSYVDKSLNREISIRERIMDPSQVDIRTTANFCDPDEAVYIKTEPVEIESIGYMQRNFIAMKRKRLEILKAISSRPAKKQKTEEVKPVVELQIVGEFEDQVAREIAIKLDSKIDLTPEEAKIYAMPEMKLKIEQNIETLSLSKVTDILDQKPLEKHDDEAEEQAAKDLLDAQEKVKKETEELINKAKEEDPEKLQEVLKELEKTNADQQKFEEIDKKIKELKEEEKEAYFNEHEEEKKFMYDYEKAKIEKMTEDEQEVYFKQQQEKGKEIEEDLNILIKEVDKEKQAEIENKREKEENEAKKLQDKEDNLIEKANNDIKEVELFEAAINNEPIENLVIQPPKKQEESEEIIIEASGKSISMPVEPEKQPTMIIGGIHEYDIPKEKINEEELKKELDVVKQKIEEQANVIQEQEEKIKELEGNENV